MKYSLCANINVKIQPKCISKIPPIKEDFLLTHENLEILNRLASDVIFTSIYFVKDVVM